MSDRESRIRERSYYLWLHEGCPEGRGDVHWDEASELVAIEDNQRLTTRPVPPADRNPATIEPIEAVENAGEFPPLPARERNRLIRIGGAKCLQSSPCHLRVSSRESRSRGGNNLGGRLFQLL